MTLKTLVAALLLAGASQFSLAENGNPAELISMGEREQALALIREGGDANAVLADGTSALTFAAHLGDPELVELLLESGARPDQSNEYGAFPLSEAALAGSNEVIRLLLAHGADANQTNPEGESALMITARTGNMAGTTLLLEHGADVNASEYWGGQSALMWATAQKQPDMMRLLISHGAQVNAQGGIRLWERRITSEPRPKDMNKGGFYPLHYAARQACIACIDVLVEAGADLNVTDPDRVTPLSLALINFHYDTAARLIEAGADVNKWDIFGRTPLYNAIDMNTLPTGGRTDIPSDDALTGVDVARLLLDNGADPNIQLKLRPPYRNVPFDRGADSPLSTGATPLMRAARAADNDAVRLLLSNGALVDLPNARGQTPLMVVSGMDYPSNPTRGRYKTEADSIITLQLLLEAGARINAMTGDPSMRDNDMPGQTALHAAARQGWNSIVQFLIDHGAAQEVPDNRGLTPIDYALGRFSAEYLEPPADAKLSTAKLLQDNCLATDNCQLKEVFDFSPYGL